MQGGLNAWIAAKAVAFLEALKPEFKAYQRAVVENAMSWEKRWQQKASSYFRNGHHLSWLT